MGGRGWQGWRGRTRGRRPGGAFGTWQGGAVTATPTPGPAPTGRRRWWRPGVLWRAVLLAATVVAVVVLTRRLEAADLVARLGSAHPRWVAAAALASLLPLLGNALSMGALSPVRLSLGRTLLVWLATSFVNLVTPSSTGGVALTVRYLQRAGLPLAAAAATIAVVQGTSGIVTAVLIAVCLVVAGRRAGVGDLVPWPVLLGAAVLAVLVLVVVRCWPRARRVVRDRLLDPVRQTWPRLRAALTDPGRLAVATLGHVAVPAGFAATLGACLLAFDASAPWPLLLLLIVGSSAVTAAVPVPGGIGAFEASLVAGLVATGVEPAAALSATLLHRFLTFWVRVPPAWLALVHLRRRGAL